MDVHAYLRAFRKSWWMVLVLTLVGVGAALLYVSRQAPVYAGHVSFYVQPGSTTGASSSSSDQQAAQDRAISYAELLSSDRLGRQIVDATGVKLLPRQVANMIGGAAQLNTVIINATVQDTSLPRLGTITQGLAEQFPVMVRQLNGADAKAAGIEVVSGPKVNPWPISPRKSLDLGLGVLLGLAIGLAAAVLRDVLDTTVHGTEAVQKGVGVPLLAAIGFDAAAKKAPLVVESSSYSERAEAFRRLRTNLQFADAARPVNVIVVTSALQGEGKTTTSVNLALVVAESGRRVLLIEGDLRRPRISGYLDIEGSVGLTNVLVGQLVVENVLQRWGASELWVLPSGTLPPNPSELLGSPAMARLLSEARERFDTIVIDAPPLLPVTDAAVLAIASDGVVLVVRHGKTKWAQLRAAVGALDSVNARVLGIVMNMLPLKGQARGSYSGYYAAHKQEPAPSEGAADTRLDIAEVFRRSTIQGSNGDSQPSSSSEQSISAAVASPESTTPAEMGTSSRSAD